MRAMTRTLVSVATAVGIAAGGVAAAGTAIAAPAQDTRTVASAGAVAPLAVNNLGLDAEEAKSVQRWLQQYWGYDGAIDGQLGTNSWKAFQRYLAAHYGYTGPIDGVVGTGTIEALQRALQEGGLYDGPVDGVAGSGTKAAFKDFADSV
ncbi:peptidoglycan-binding domain-containing protein [Streptomyces ureilyticus]|uniref:Peptidoglycan-binding protein n=1 Tax=Streptomyces ureilyticus TaxID=1775131 RepID=A0ABX0E4S2_9ACTN|nr:peptidoglycan-binding domain-containing protein [Streptomyces ureilyticus]NGO49212.1 peptidoglycan-binding protein [Streptomyces ureilyticus]